MRKQKFSDEDIDATMNKIGVILFIIGIGTAFISPIGFIPIIFGAFIVMAAY